MKKEPRNLCDILDEFLDTMETVAQEAAAEEKEAKLAELKDQFDDSAEQLFMAYESFIEAGFDENQAFKLLLTIVENTMKGGTSRA